VNKNTLIAFILILGSVMLFTHPSYNKFVQEKIFHQKVTEQPKKAPETTNTQTPEFPEAAPSNSELKPLVEEQKTTPPIDSVLLSGDTIWFENEKMKVAIKEEGAIITSIIMKNYQYHSTNIDLIENTSNGGGQLTIANKSFDKKLFKHQGSQKFNRINQNSEKFDFIYVDQDGSQIIKSFEFLKNEYIINIKINKNDLPGQRISLGWYCGIIESEKNQQKNTMERIKIHLSNGESVQHTIMNKEGSDDQSGRFEWLGITSKYFFIALNNDSIIDSDIHFETIKSAAKDKNYNYKLQVSRMAEKQQENFSLYAGPNERYELKKYNKKYEQILFPVIGWTRIFFWSEKWFPWLADLVLLLLLEIQKIVKDYGIAILIITIITKIVTYPLTISSMKSMEKMKDIQPKVNAIRAKHKNNAQKMNEEVMALYKKEGINPLNPGCLPLFLQMPVFISLFVVLRKAIEIRSEGTFLIPWIKDLSQPEVIFSLDKIIPGGIPLYGSNVALLPIIMAVLTFFQQKMTIKDPNQKMLIYFMPIFMLVLFNSFSAGLVLYWTFSSALQIVQQLLMNRKKVVVVKK
jgi:YidC/Oxa1 family membrane protein insertase